MEPVFLYVQQGMEQVVFDANYFIMDSGDREDDDMSCGTFRRHAQEDEDSEDGQSIDYGDTETEGTLENDEEEEIIEFVEGALYHGFLESISVPNPEMENALEISRLETLLANCTTISKEVSVEEDYITNRKFENGENAIVIVSKVGNQKITYYQNPLHLSTVKEILKSGNTRNPCDNNPTDSYLSVKIKLN
jgi:hypothetical protein